MPFPIFLYALWALWPLAAYPGGKLFAPLVFLIGLFALPTLRTGKLNLAVKTGLALLVWICLSALWSPANEGLFSGSLLAENFALEASYLRFAFTLIGCFLFVRLVLHARAETIQKVPVWIYAGIGVHILIVMFMAIMRGQLLLSQGDFLVPTGQSMGRNVNLLMMGSLLLIGGLILSWQSLRLYLLCGGLLTGILVLSFRLDGMAAVFALLVSGLVFTILHYGKTGGFRAVFNLVALSLITAPGIAWALGGIAPNLVGNIPLTAQQRLLIWQATLERIAEKPFFGHGVNAAPTWLETYASRPEFLEQLSPELINHRIIPNHPHNMAMQIWAETGFIGAALGTILLVMAGRKLPRPETLSGGVKIAAAGLFGTAISYFAVSYSVWDESYWASIAIILSGIIVLHKVRTA